MRPVCVVMLCVGLVLCGCCATGSADPIKTQSPEASSEDTTTTTTATDSKTVVEESSVLERKSDTTTSSAAQENLELKTEVSPEQGSSTASSTVSITPDQVVSSTVTQNGTGSKPQQSESALLGTERGTTALTALSQKDSKGSGNKPSAQSHPSDQGEGEGRENGKALGKIGISSPPQGVTGTHSITNTQQAAEPITYVESNEKNVHTSQLGTDRLPTGNRSPTPGVQVDDEAHSENSATVNTITKHASTTNQGTGTTTSARELLEHKIPKDKTVLPEIRTGAGKATDRKTSAALSQTHPDTDDAKATTISLPAAENRLDPTTEIEMPQDTTYPTTTKRTLTAPTTLPLSTVSNALPLHHSVGNTDSILCSSSLFALAALATLAVAAAAPAH